MPYDVPNVIWICVCKKITMKSSTKRNEWALTAILILLVTTITIASILRKITTTILNSRLCFCKQFFNTANSFGISRKSKNHCSDATFATCGHLELEINNCFINDCTFAYGFGIILQMLMYTKYLCKNGRRKNVYRISILNKNRLIHYQN